MATSQIGNPFERGAAAALADQERQKELVDQQPKEQEEPKKQRKTRKPKTTQVAKQDTEKKEQPMESSDQTSQFSGPLVTANFKIPSDARKRLKVFAAKNDMTSVQVLLQMIAKLPE